MIKSIHWPVFYTATILEWRHLLTDRHKDIIVESLKFLVDGKRISLFGFVIMSNHIHLIWQTLIPFLPEKIQQSFMKFSAQQIKFDIMATSPLLLEPFRVNAKDREYQIWERLPLKIELFSPPVFHQKLNYIHNNPVVAGLCKFPEDYHYSSARFYLDGFDHFNMLTHFND